MGVILIGILVHTSPKVYLVFNAYFFKLRGKTASRKDTMPKASQFVPNKQLVFVLFLKQNT